MKGPKHFGIASNTFIYEYRGDRYIQPFVGEDKWNEEEKLQWLAMLNRIENYIKDKNYEKRVNNKGMIPGVSVPVMLPMIPEEYQYEDTLDGKKIEWNRRLSINIKDDILTPTKEMFDYVIKKVSLLEDI
jgi:hypothetical protein